MSDEEGGTAAETNADQGKEAVIIAAQLRSFLIM